MPKTRPADDFGSYLRLLRKRARITQRDFGIATGYSEGQICRFEQGHKPPDLSTLVALFVPALDVKDAPHEVARLLELAATARGDTLDDKQIHKSGPTAVTQFSQTPSTRPPTPPIPNGKMGKHEREAHLAAARWALNAEGDVVEAARHYLAVGDIAAAIDAFYDRGVALFNQGRWESAAEVIDQLLAHVEHGMPSDRQSNTMRCQLYEIRGDLLLHTVRAEEAQHNFETALALADGAVHAKLAHKLCVCLAQRGKPSEALTLAESILRDIDPKHILLIAQLRIAEANALMSLGRLAQSMHSSHEALRLTDKMTLFAPVLAMSIRARAHNFLGALNAMQRQPAAALEHWQQAKRYAADSGLAQIQYRSEGNIATLLYEQGDIGAALSASQTAIYGLNEIGDTYGKARFIHLQSILHYIQANYTESIAVSQQSEALKRTLGDVAGVIGAQNQRAKALLALGRVAEANTLGQSALSMAQDINDARLLAFSWLLCCDCALAQGDDTAAMQWVKQAQACAEHAKPDKTLAHDLPTHEAWAWLSAGQTAQAAVVLQADPLAPNASLEVQLERQTVSLLCHPTADANGAAALATALAHGYVHHARIIERAAEARHQTTSPSSLVAQVLFGAA
ncbi:MAG: helix-turn-helix domain-containing protein [Anaerolineae bacterium]|nr:helix-turn-helix domain-containing protein [Anaerolineae bacterium]